jgi:hypothetical protein
LSSYIPPSSSLYDSLAEAEQEQLPGTLWISSPTVQTWLVLLAATFLVTVPIFLQAPLVRVLPWFSVILTAGWLGLSWLLWQRPSTKLWADLLFGFSWTWLAGSIYWGWLRWEPLWHLPIESIGLPFAIFFLVRQQGKVGNWFYLGSLFGTAITDLYFYMTDLIPYWRQVMQAEPQLVQPIFQAAVAQMHTGWGTGVAVLLVAVLLLVGGLPLRATQLHWWAFGGAVLSTLLVDGLFWIAATTA